MSKFTRTTEKSDPNNRVMVPGVSLIVMKDVHKLPHSPGIRTRVVPTEDVQKVQDSLSWGQRRITSVTDFV